MLAWSHLDQTETRMTPSAQNFVQTFLAGTRSSSLSREDAEILRRGQERDKEQIAVEQHSWDGHSGKTREGSIKPEGWRAEKYVYPSPCPCLVLHSSSSSKTSFDRCKWVYMDLSAEHRLGSQNSSPLVWCCSWAAKSSIHTATPETGSYRACVPGWTACTLNFTISLQTKNVGEIQR